MQDAAEHREIAWRRKLRAEESALPPDPLDWLRSSRMTRTETSLRIALHLVRERCATSDVSVSLTGRELTRTRRPRFPVVRFLQQQGCARAGVRGRSSEWRARYAVQDSSLVLVLNDEREACDVMVPASPDSRILVFAGGGSVTPTRSSAEHHALRALIGRALTFEGIQPHDLLVVAVPRSARTRKLAQAMRLAPRVMQAGVRVCMVDRAGGVSGGPGE